MLREEVFGRPEQSEPFGVLTPAGETTDESLLRFLSVAEMVDIYEEMKLIRRYDRQAVSLQRQGRSGTYPPLYGHEATQIGSVHALEEDDWLYPSYRENGAMIAHGVSLSRNLLYWMGHSAGSDFPEGTNVFPIVNPIATHIPIATGMAWAAKLRGDAKAMLCHFGDGATSEGDFHEGLNFAGVFDTPSVFFCNNNKWAISVPRERQTASETISQKATAYGFRGIQVDGMDPLAVYLATKAAVEKAKDPKEDEKRPTLIEAVLYRLGAHSTSDDPAVYRDEAVSNEWAEKDPITRLEKFLRERGHLDQELIADIESRIEERITDAVEEAERYEADRDDMITHTFAELDSALQDQLEYLRSLPEASVSEDS